MSACLSSRKGAIKVDWESRRDIIQIAKEKMSIKTILAKIHAHAPKIRDGIDNQK